MRLIFLEIFNDEYLKKYQFYDKFNLNSGFVFIQYLYCRLHVADYDLVDVLEKDEKKTLSIVELEYSVSCIFAHVQDRYSNFVLGDVLAYFRLPLMVIIEFHKKVKSANIYSFFFVFVERNHIRVCRAIKILF